MRMLTDSERRKLTNRESQCADESVPDGDLSLEPSEQLVKDGRCVWVECHQCEAQHRVNTWLGDKALRVDAIARAMGVTS